MYTIAHLNFFVRVLCVCVCAGVGVCHYEVSDLIVCVAADAAD